MNDISNRSQLWFPTAAIEKFVQNTMLKLMHTVGHPSFAQALADLISNPNKETPIKPPPAPGAEDGETPPQPPNKKPRKAGTSGDQGDLQSALAAKLAELE